MLHAKNVRLLALVFAFLVAVGFGGYASAAPPKPEPRCEHQHERCPRKVKSIKSLPHPRSDCRWDAYYPSVEDKVRCVLVYNGQSANWETWRCIAEHESHWNPYVTGGAGERGIFQIHPVNFKKFEWWRLYDPVYNTFAAIVMYRDAGYSWWPWTTYRVYCS